MKGCIIKTLEHDYTHLHDSGLKVGDIVNIRMWETHLQHRQQDWFLIDTPDYYSYIYQGEKDREWTCTYKDPLLGDYNSGYYQWIGSEYVSIVYETNKQAVLLLKQDEWSL